MFVLHNTKIYQTCKRYGFFNRTFFFFLEGVYLTQISNKRQVKQKGFCSSCL